jgi:hypothetical protein
LSVVIRLDGQRCEVKKGLFRCSSEAVGLCQYCGRPFCREHGELLGDAQEICDRKTCQEKRSDVERHQAYKQFVVMRNEVSSCGVPGCAGELAAQCSRCRGLFCAGHVARREETVVENHRRVTKMTALCDHCWARRPLWSRR